MIGGEIAPHHHLRTTLKNCSNFLQGTVTSLQDIELCCNMWVGGSIKPIPAYMFCAGSLFAKFTGSVAHDSIIEGVGNRIFFNLK